MNRICFPCIFLFVFALHSFAKPIHEDSLEISNNYFPSTESASDFHYEYHTVLPGESVVKITRRYYGNEDLTLLLADNPDLKNHPVHNLLGNIVNYMVYPRDQLRVRIYQPVQVYRPEPEFNAEENVLMRTPTTIINNYYSTVGIPAGTVWIGFGCMLLIIFGLCFIIVMLLTRKPNESPAKPQELPTLNLRFKFSFIGKKKKKDKKKKSGK